jgi:hypothetical protein
MPAEAANYEIKPQAFIRPSPEHGREYARLRALVEMPDHGDEAVRVARDLLRMVLDCPRPSAPLSDRLSDAVLADAMTLFLVERGVALSDGDIDPFIRTSRVARAG